MRVAAAIVAMAGVWGGSAYMSGRIAARKARGVKRWVILGLILGPFVFPVHACYPSRYKPETMECPECGKELKIFGGDGGDRVAGELGSEVMGRIPIVPDATGEPGRSLFDVDSSPARAFDEIAAALASTKVRRRIKVL